MFAQRFFVLILILVITASASVGQSSTFTYQGKLFETLGPANGTYQMQFSLWDAVTDGSQVGLIITNNSVTVSGGVFKVDLDFNSPTICPGCFNGNPRWIEIAVKKPADATFTTLTPRQPLTSAPYSIRSLNAENAVSSQHATNVSGGTVSGDGAGLVNINGANIASGTVTSTQLSADAVPNSSAYKLLGSLRWDLLKPQNNFAVGTSPREVAFDGSSIWVSNSASNNVTKLRVSDGTNLGTFAVGTGPRGVAFDGANIWVANTGSNNVTKLRASDGANLGDFNVGSAPRGVAFDGVNIWVANGGSNDVSKLRASDGAPQGTFAVGPTPTGLAFDGANMWVTNNGAMTVTKVRVSDGSSVGTFNVGPSPSGIAFDGANIWATAGGAGGFVTKLRAADGANMGSFGSLSAPTGVAFDGANIWVTNTGSITVNKFRASDSADLGIFEVGGGQPRGVAFDGTNIWVVNTSAHNVTRLFPAFPQP